MTRKRIDRQLKHLALEAQKNPAKSPERQKALTELLEGITTSGYLCSPYKGLFSPLYDEIYSEAKQKLFIYICEKIEQYNPEYEVLQWANFIFRKRFFIETIREIWSQSNEENPNIKNRFFLSLDELESELTDLVYGEVSPCLSQEIMVCLEEDPEGLFKDTYTKKKEANFQFIAQRILNGYKLREIAEELELDISTIHSFYQRKLKKFSVKFKEYIIV